MSLETYISDLLYRYDLVIIPGFGAIIGRKRPARYVAENYTFLPPHKDLSFNPQLKENDGLLTNYIAEMSGISYGEALAYIEKEVEKWQEVLKKDKRLRLENIGIFNRINEEQLIFLPLTTKNYLASAYGLISFRRKPAGKKTIEKNIHSVTSVTEKTKTVKLKSKENNDFKVWQYAAVLVVGLGLFTTGVSWLKSQNSVEEPTFQKATFVLKKDFPAIKIVKNAPVKTTAQKKYFIITGAFRDKTNAEKKRLQLIKTGFPAKIIGQNQYGLWMVASHSFDSDVKAHEVLTKLKEQMPGAWVLEKK